MELPKRRSANVQGYLGTTLSIHNHGKPTRKQKSSEGNQHDSSSEVRHRQRIVIPSLGRRSPTRFTKIDDRGCDDRIVDDTPPSPGSSITSRSSLSGEMNDAVKILPLVDKPTTTSATSTISDGSLVQSSSNRKAYSSERSLSWDDSTLTTARAEQSSSGQNESASVLDFMDQLDDVDESYMLSIFWNSGDLMTVKDAKTTSSSAAGTKCSYASTCSSMTSTSSYTWTTATRNRHKGAYKNRIVNDAPIASWLDTMDETSNLLFGPLNSWSATRGWKSGQTSKWDPKPNRTTWDTPDPVYDKEGYRNETTIQWISPESDALQ